MFGPRSGYKTITARHEAKSIRREGDMNKRKLGSFVLCAMLFALCFPAEAQQPVKVYRIGFLSGAFPGPTHWTARLRAELQKLGYVEGKNIVIDARFTENKFERLPALADELVRLKPDVIVTGGINDARAAQNATKKIPIVGLSIGEQIATKFDQSLDKPGR